MRCPICKRRVDFSKPAQPAGFYPFCSERCKLIDLGRWLGDRYQIPVSEDEGAAGAPETVPGSEDDDAPPG